MNKKILLIFMMIILALPMVSATNISDCGALSAGSHVLTTSINSTAPTCFTIALGNVSLDCQGYTINNTAFTVTDNFIDLQGDSINFTNCHVLNYAMESDETNIVRGYNSTFGYSGAFDLRGENYFDNITFYSIAFNSAGMSFGNNAIINNSNFTTVGRQFLVANNENLTIENTVFNNFTTYFNIANGTTMRNCNFTNTPGYSSKFILGTNVRDILIDNCNFQDTSSSNVISILGVRANNITISNSNFTDVGVDILIGNSSLINNYFNTGSSKHFYIRGDVIDINNTEIYIDEAATTFQIYGPVDIYNMTLTGIFNTYIYNATTIDALNASTSSNIYLSLEDSGILRNSNITCADLVFNQPSFTPTLTFTNNIFNASDYTYTTEAHTTYTNNTIYFNVTTTNKDNFFSDYSRYIGNSFVGNGEAISADTILTNLHFENNTIDDFDAFNLVLNNSNMTNNTFTDSIYYVSSSTDLLIQNNTFNNAGIYGQKLFNYGNNITIRYNNFYNLTNANVFDVGYGILNASAMYLLYSENSTIYNNYCEDVVRVCIGTINVSHTIIYNNTANNSRIYASEGVVGHGIMLRDYSYNVSAYNNTLYDVAFLFEEPVYNSYIYSNYQYGGDVFYTLHDPYNNQAWDNYVDGRVEFRDGAINNTFWNFTITGDVIFRNGTDSVGSAGQESYNNMLRDSTIAGDVTNYDNSYNNTILNCTVTGTISNADVLSGAYMNIQEYLILIGNATVVATSNNGTTEISTTNTNRTAYPLLEYRLNESVQVNYTPYNINVVKNNWNKNYTVSLTSQTELNLTHLNISTEETAIAAMDADITAAAFEDTSNTSLSDTVSIDQNISLLMTLTTNTKTATVDLLEFEGTYMYWDTMNFTVDTTTTSTYATNVNTNASITTDYLVLFNNTDSFLPEANFGSGVKIKLAAVTAPTTVVFVANDTGVNTTAITTTCTATGPTLPVTTSNMCYYDDGTDLYVWIPHLSGIAVDMPAAATTTTDTSDSSSDNDGYNPTASSDNGDTITVYGGLDVTIEYDDVDYTLEMDPMVYETEVIFTIEGIEYSMEEGDYIEIDLDGDGNKDISIKVEDIRRPYADLLIKELIVTEQVTPDVEEEPEVPTTEEIPEEIETTSNALYWIWASITILILGFGSYFIHKKKD